MVLDAPAAIPGVAVVASSPIGVPANVKDLGVSPVSAQAKPASEARVGGDLRTAALIKKVNPVYPENLRQSHVQGTVRFSATIGKDGKLRDIRLVSGNPVLVQPATAAVKQWVYRPTMLSRGATWKSSLKSTSISPWAASSLPFEWTNLL